MLAYKCTYDQREHSHYYRLRQLELQALILLVMHSARAAGFAQNFVFTLLVVSSVFGLLELAKPCMGVEGFLLELLKLLFHLFVLFIQCCKFLISLSGVLVCKHRQLLLGILLGLLSW